MLRASVTADQENGHDCGSVLMVETMTTVRRSNAGTIIRRLRVGTLVEFAR